MKRNFAIIGLGRFGGSICQALAETGQEVLAIDNDENCVNKYMNIATHAVVANAQDEAVPRSLGIRNFDYLVIAIGEDIQASILVTLMIKEMGVKKVVTKAINEYHARVLEKIGADLVVHPERDMGIRIAHQLVSENILDYIELSNEVSLVEVRVSNPKFYNKTLSELNFRQHFGLTVVAIKRSKTQVIASPSAHEMVRENDNLLVVGDTDAVNVLAEKMNRYDK